MAGYPLRWDRIVYRGSIPERNFSAFYRDGKRVVAVLGVNRSKDVRAGRSLIQAGIDVDDAVLADEGTDLRALAKAAQ
jgi:3-phenylpropionate/trans-cinnamate dioxygenase ferredoxin reductase subunit